MSLKINDVKIIFDKYLPKKELSLLSYDSSNNYSVIVSATKWYDFDCSEKGASRLCTLDAAEIINDKIIFAEFKNEIIKSGDKFKFLRLKATESYMSLHKLLCNDLINLKIGEVDQISKECYFVFCKVKTKPTALLAFNTTHRILKSYYEASIYDKFDFIDSESFKKKFGV